MAFDPITGVLGLATAVVQRSGGSDSGPDYSKPDEVARVALLAGGDVSWFLNRESPLTQEQYKSGNQPGQRNAPFRASKSSDLTQDQQLANVLSYLAQSFNAGQGPSMTATAQDVLKRTLDRINASKAGAGRDGQGMNLPLLRSSGPGRDSTGGPVNVSGGLSTMTLLILGALAYLLLR